MFQIRLAGISIGVTSLFETTKRFCTGYLTEECPLFFIEMHPEDIVRERQMAAFEDQKEGRPIRRFPDYYLETIALYRKIAAGLLTYDILLFHGSAIAVDNEAYLFTAKSGTGKSTHTRLWREHFNTRAVMINDDKPLLKIEKNSITVCGTPWNGKHHLGNDLMVPLKALCVLERSSKNHIERIDPHTVWPMLLQQCYRPPEAKMLERVICLLEESMQKTAFYRLGCNMEPEAAIVSYEGMQ